MTENKPKQPRAKHQLAKSIADLTSDVGKDPAAVALGRKGGLKGGVARAAKLSALQRSEIARKAAKARWKKDDKDV